MSALHLTLGVDPGQTGAIAVLADGRLERFVDMPVMARAAGGNEIDGAALAAAIREARTRHPGADIQAVLEQVNAMPSKPGANGERRGMGNTSAFNFGEGFGVVKGVIATLGIPLTLVHPARWKKAYGLIGKDKDVARTVAIQRHPEAAGGLTRKKDIGRADALLIGAWARRAELVGDVERREAA